MKSESEKKVPTAIRLSPNERRIVEEKAEAKGMKLTSYIAFMAVHGETGVTPEAMVEIQNLINRAHDVVKKTDPDEAQALEKEMNELWFLLNSKQI